MEQRDVFDVNKEPAAEFEKYGKFDFGRHCLMARRLLENGIPFVQVSHSNYDTHNENFNFHLEQLGEFDQAFSALVGDLAERGLLESTLVVVMSEFGRTPKINARYRPRSLGHGVVGVSRRRQGAARRGHRQDEQKRHRGRRSASGPRPSVPHLSRCDRPGFHRPLRRRRPPDPPRRSRPPNDCGTVELTTTKPRAKALSVVDRPQADRLAGVYAISPLHSSIFYTFRLLP